LKKGGHEITFDIVINTPKGVVYAMYFRRDSELAGAATDKTVKLTIQQAHDRLGHFGEDATRQTAKQLGWELTKGSLKPCESCAAAGKAKQRNIPKDNNGESLKLHESRIYLDIATVKKKEGQPNATKANWRIMVDERTRLKFSDFYANNNEMVEPTCEQFVRWKQTQKPVTYLRLDNAGENKLLQSQCDSKDWKLGIKCEFTARDTPQQNSLAEVSLATIANCERSMMARANIPYKIRFRLWSEAFKVATLLDGLTPIEIDGVVATRYEYWCGRNPKFTAHLRVWGEAGTVKVLTKTSPKVKDRGVQCVMVGYAKDHTGDTYRM
jgi:hypothetical protein